MVEKPAFALLRAPWSVFFFIVVIMAVSKATSSPWPRTRTLFPGPVTPDRFCADPPLERGGGPPEASRELLQEQLGRLAFASSSVTGDRSVLLLQYAENLVRNRAYFYSVALQMLNSTFHEYLLQPGFLYYYVSAATALFSAPEALVASGVFFDADKHYPNWYRGVYFNGTLPRFAPRATRQSTPELRVDDYGAMARDYTSLQRGSGPPTNARVFRFQRQKANGDVSEVAIFGAPHDAGLRVSDVYYDCAHGNRSLVTLAFPAMEILPRYCAWTFLRNPKNVAAATAELDVGQLVSGLPAEVPLFHNMLAIDRKCPDPVPPAPGPRDLSHAFFRSLYPQSRLALRLAHSLSAFLQNLDAVTTELDYENNGITYAPYEPFPNTSSAKVKADPALDDSLLEAEILANLLADSKILASGVFFESELVTGSDGMPSSTPRKAFQAWRGAGGPVVRDLSSSNWDPNLPLTSRARIVWRNAHTSPKLRTHTFHAGIRSSKAGGGVDDFAVDPLQYRAVPLAEGYWTSHHFKCDGYVDQWVVAYAAPFFGPSVAEPGKLILRGTVTVDIAVTAENWAA